MKSTQNNAQCAVCNVCTHKLAIILWCVLLHLALSCQCLDKIKMAKLSNMNRDITIVDQELAGG